MQQINCLAGCVGDSSILLKPKTFDVDAIQVGPQKVGYHFEITISVHS